MDTLVPTNNVQKNAGFDSKNANCPTNLTNSGKLNIFKKYDILNRYVDTHTHTRIRDTGKLVGLVGQEAKKPNFPDPRFASKSFCRKVRYVLDWLGEPQTFGSFQKWQAWGMDWERQYEALVNPVRFCQVYILDRDGHKIWLSDEQRYAMALVSEAELKANEKVKYEFYRQWPSPARAEIVDPGQS